MDGTASTVESRLGLWKRVPGMAKIAMLAEALVIMFLSGWLYEEYVSNPYMQVYVNNFLGSSAGMMTILGGVVAVIGLGTVGLLYRAKAARKVGTGLIVARVAVPVSNASLKLTKGVSSEMAESGSLHPAVAAMKAQIIGPPTVTAGEVPELKPEPPAVARGAETRSSPSQGNVVPLVKRTEIVASSSPWSAVQGAREVATVGSSLSGSAVSAPKGPGVLTSPSPGSVAQGARGAPIFARPSQGSAGSAPQGTGTLASPFYRSVVQGAKGAVIVTGPLPGRAGPMSGTSGVFTGTSPRSVLPVAGRTGAPANPSQGSPAQAPKGTETTTGLSPEKAGLVVTGIVALLKKGEPVNQSGEKTGSQSNPVQ